MGRTLAVGGNRKSPATRGCAAPFFSRLSAVVWAIAATRRTARVALVRRLLGARGARLQAHASGRPGWRYVPCLAPRGVAPPHERSGLPEGRLTAASSSCTDVPARFRLGPCGTVDTRDPWRRLGLTRVPTCGIPWRTVHTRRLHAPGSSGRARRVPRG